MRCMPGILVRGVWIPAVMVSPPVVADSTAVAPRFGRAMSRVGLQFEDARGFALSSAAIRAGHSRVASLLAVFAGYTGSDGPLPVFRSDLWTRHCDKFCQASLVDPLVSILGENGCCGRLMREDVGPQYYIGIYRGCLCPLGETTAFESWPLPLTA